MSFALSNSLHGLFCIQLTRLCIARGHVKVQMTVAQEHALDDVAAVIHEQCSDEKYRQGGSQT